MIRRLTIFSRYFTPLLSLVVFVAAAWLWHRSMSVTEYCYRYQPTNGGVIMRGIGSHRGAALFGSIFDPSPLLGPGTGYSHDVFPQADGGKGGSVLKSRPFYKVGGLGFGVSRGELTIRLPLAFLILSPRAYQVTYVPYYFIMLMAAVHPVLSARKMVMEMRSRRFSVEPPDRSPVAMAEALP